MQSIKKFTLADAREMLRLRPADGHKGTFGTALFVCGSYAIGGCAILAARACLRSGVGKVYIHVPRSLREVVMTAVPEAVLSIDSGQSGTIITEVPKGPFNAIAIGPGIGTDDYTAEALFRSFKHYGNIPHIIDADALNILSQYHEWGSGLPHGAIITPHLGELSRLLKIEVADKDRQTYAQQAADTGEAVIVAKGHPTFVASKGTELSANTTGTDAMATAGSGDVLTGVITALVAQGYPADEAARLGVFVHGLAGDIAAEKLGHYGVIASDIVDNLPLAFMSIANA